MKNNAKGQMITFLLFLALLAPTSDKGFIGAYMNNRCGSLAHHFNCPACGNS